MKTIFLNEFVRLDRQTVCFFVCSLYSLQNTINTPNKKIGHGAKTNKLVDLSLVNKFMLFTVVLWAYPPIFILIIWLIFEKH